jgi:hypothetical protein
MFLQNASEKSGSLHGILIDPEDGSSMLIHNASENLGVYM